jgi:hypothetical protein
MDRFEDALSDLHATLGVTDSLARLHDSPYDRRQLAPLTAFMNHYLVTKVAVEQRQWDAARAAIDRAAAIANVARVPCYAQALARLELDMLLRRNLPPDAQHRRALIVGAEAHAPCLSIAGWSDCRALLKARSAAREQSADAFDLLYAALNMLEENAHQAPLDADRAFGHLGDAADEVRATGLASAARERQRHYERVRRVAMAGSEFSGVADAVAVPHRAV